MICRILFIAFIVLGASTFVVNQPTHAQGGDRVRYWITCPANQDANIYIYTDPYPWPEIWLYATPGNPHGEGPMSASEVQPKVINPHAHGADSIDYRLTARFSDGHSETHYLYYRYPNGCNPSQPQPVHPTVPPPPTQPPAPYINFFANATTINRGDCTNVVWNTQNVREVYYNGEYVASNASRTECPSNTTNYTLRVLTYFGEELRSVRITVLIPPTPIPPTPIPPTPIPPTPIPPTPIPPTPISPTSIPQAQISFSTNATMLKEGDCATITWSVQNVTAVYYNGQRVADNDSRTECPIATTTYRLFVEALSGNVERLINVIVLPKPTSAILFPLGLFLLAAAAGLFWYAREVRRKRLLARTKTMPPLVGGNYEILHPIGSGGQGNLFLARHRSLGNYVALKQDDSGDATQFQYEAQLLANLAHPNLPRVTDFFIDGNGKRCLVMDYIQGENLEQLIQKNGALAETTALTWMRPIFDAVKYLHANRIVHRDIKPANIIITDATPRFPAGSSGRGVASTQGNAMLVDFGIAKTMATGQLTRTGARGMGTAGYAPPEQYSGGTREASDVYALGATLYYMLTGRVPVESTHRAAGTDLIPPRQINPNITPRTEYTILTAMNLAMNQRYASVAAMEQGLY